MPAEDPLAHGAHAAAPPVEDHHATPGSVALRDVPPEPGVPVVVPLPLSELTVPSEPFGPGEALATLVASRPRLPVLPDVPFDPGVPVVVPLPLSALMEASDPFGPGEAFATLAVTRPDLPPVLVPRCTCP